MKPIILIDKEKAREQIQSIVKYKIEQKQCLQELDNIQNINMNVQQKRQLFKSYMNNYYKIVKEDE